MESTSYISQIAYDIEDWLFLGYTIDRIETEIIILQGKGEFPPNLVLVDAYFDTRFGSSGCAFLDTNTGEIIVGFAGTNLNNGIRESVKDIRADAAIAGIGIDANSLYMQQANSFIKKLESQGCNVVQTTGHSLGGALSVLVAINHNIPSVVTYNAAPLYGITGLIVSTGGLVRNYNGRVIQFVTDKDWLNSLSDIFGAYYVGEKYIFYNNKGHGIDFFLNSDEQAYIMKVMLMEQGFLEGKVGFAIDFNRDGTIDLQLLPEMLQPKNLLMITGEDGNGVGQSIKLSPESLEALGFNLMEMNANDLDWIGQAIRECTNKNEDILNNLEPRQDTLIEDIVDGLNASSLKELLHGINESYGVLEKQKRTLQTLRDFNAKDVTRNFNRWGSSAGRTWYADGEKWDESAFIRAVKSLQTSSGVVLHQVEATGTLTYQDHYGRGGNKIYTYDTLTKITETFVNVTNSLEPKIRKVFEGTGLRDGMQDGISGAIKEVLLVEEQNVNELQKSVSSLSQIAHGVSQNFSEMDSWLKSFMDNDTSGAFLTTALPETYEAYLEESHILDDVKDVLEAFDSQVAKRSDLLAKEIIGCYDDLLERFYQYYNSLITYMDDFRKSITSLSEWMNKRITSEWSEVTSKGQMYQIETLEKKESHGLLSSFFPRSVVDSIEDANRKIVPLIDIFDQTLVMAGIFGSRLYDLCAYLKVFVERGVYKSMELDGIVVAQNGIEQMLNKMIGELGNLNTQIESDMQGKALESFSDQITNVIQLMEYFEQMIFDCFGTKGAEDIPVTNVRR